ncbi:MAG: platelet-activating factor acetylhydrolase IB subunit [Verrucomicrobiota bacterium]|nr:platelet-activating factor acetylhydrolase IB subunit [Verrucomicrobiota bacterium]
MKPIFFLTTVLFSLSVIAEEKLHSATKPVPRSGGWMKRHESFNKRVAQGKCDLIFIGDSITQGWEGRGRKVWAKFYAKRNVVNLGISGDRTQHVIWRLDNGNLYRIKPKAAVIMIGTNNSGSNTSQEIADGLGVIVKQLRKKLPDTKLLLLGVFPRGTNNTDKRRKVNEGANAIFKKLADGKAVHYLDIGPNFLQKDGALPREIMPDLLHLSEKGYTIWAESIEAKLEELMGE